jgi:hypothetical protein
MPSVVTNLFYTTCSEYMKYKCGEEMRTEHGMGAHEDVDDGFM